jgi:hypothetical protein
MLIEDETRMHVAPNGARYRIQFHHDDYRENPWEQWDCMTPLAVKSFGYGGRSDVTEYGGFDILDPIAYMTDRQVTECRAAIANAIGAVGNGWTDAESFDAYVKEEARDSGYPVADVRRDILSETVDDCKDFDVLAALWCIAGVPALSTSSQGYSQGDYHELLLVAHPDAVKAWGFKSLRAYIAKNGGNVESAAQSLESDCDTWGAYAWGGVIGYTVELIDNDELREVCEDSDDDADSPSDSTLNDLDLCEEVDSCWGFYPEGSSDAFPLDKVHVYAVSQAVAAADYHGRVAA